MEIQTRQIIFFSQSSSQLSHIAVYANFTENPQTLHRVPSHPSLNTEIISVSIICNLQFNSCIICTIWMEQQRNKNKLQWFGHPHQRTTHVLTVNCEVIHDIGKKPNNNIFKIRSENNISYWIIFFLLLAKKVNVNGKSMFVLGTYNT